MDELLQPVSIPATHVSEISTDNSDICDIQENDFLLFGDKTLVLNSVLAYAYHTLGPINTKLLSHQLCEFYDGDKLLSAYKLICSLNASSKRALRQRQNPNTWNSNSLALHIINQVRDLQNSKSDIIFASLDLNVPLRELSKPSSSASNTMKKLLNFGKKDMTDKGCQCDISKSVSEDASIMSGTATNATTLIYCLSMVTQNSCRQ